MIGMQFVCFNRANNGVKSTANMFAICNSYFYYLYNFFFVFFRFPYIWEKIWTLLLFSTQYETKTTKIIAVQIRSSAHYKPHIKNPILPNCNISNTLKYLIKNNFCSMYDSELVYAVVFRSRMVERDIYTRYTLKIRKMYNNWA